MGNILILLVLVFLIIVFFFSSFFFFSLNEQKHMREHYIPENIFTLQFSLSIFSFTNTAVYEWRKKEANSFHSLENTQISQEEDGSN